MFKCWSFCRHQGHPLHCIIYLELSLFVIKNIICTKTKQKDKKKERKKKKKTGKVLRVDRGRASFSKLSIKAKCTLGFQSVG